MLHTENEFGNVNTCCEGVFLNYRLKHTCLGLFSSWPFTFQNFHLGPSNLIYFPAWPLGFKNEGLKWIFETLRAKWKNESNMKGQSVILKYKRLKLKQPQSLTAKSWI